MHSHIYRPFFNLFKDRYEELRPLGRGSMGRVYLVRDRKLNKNWAVKEIEADCVTAAGEIGFLKNLEHEGLPRIVDVYQEDGRIYLVMDYVEGVDLKRAAERKYLDEKLLRQIALQLCDILIYLHSRPDPVVYRDLKPSNIMLTPGGRVMLVDLGSCERLSRCYLSPSLGSRAYAAPEASLGRPCPQSDVYSLGRTLLELMKSGRFSRHLKRVAKKCCAPETGDRYATALEVKKALERRSFLPVPVAALVAAGMVFAASGIIFGQKNRRLQESSAAAEAAIMPDGAENGTPADEGTGEENEDKAAGKELLEIRERLEMLSGDGKAVDTAMLGELKDIRKRLEEMEKYGMLEKKEDMESLRECRIEDLSMLSVIYRLLGTKNEDFRDEYYTRAEKCISELLSVRGVKESRVYRGRLSDLVSIKEALGRGEEVIPYLKEWEEDHPEDGKELYFAHAFILLRSPGNGEDLKLLYERMKEADEVAGDPRFEGLGEQLEYYLESEWRDR